MTAPTPYLHFPGNAREALSFYGSTFGGDVAIHTFAEFGRTDGPDDAVAHGYVRNGPVSLFAADTADDAGALQCRGLMLALLGAAPPDTLRDWFSRLADGGEIVDPLQPRPWGDSDGQVIDSFGVHWLIGYQGT